MRCKSSRTALLGAVVIGTVISFAAWAQTPPAGGQGGDGMGAMQMPSPAEQAIEYRKSLFTVISGNFGPIGNMLQGRADFNGADAAKRAARTAQLAAMLDDAFPDISKTGDTKAKPEIWTNKTDFDKISKDFMTHTADLAAVLKKDSSNSADFKKAATAVAQDCRSCHEQFKAR